MVSDGELWHLVEARRDDGTPAMFRIRDVEPRPEQPRIFVVEFPYPVTGLSRLPDAAAYRRLTQFEEQWLAPACTTLGWTFVAAKTEDGSFFLYLYGSDDPTGMIEKLSPFDGSLGFFDEQDPNWDEYAALRELLDQANAMPPAQELEPEVTAPALLTPPPPVDETSVNIAAAPASEKPPRKRAPTMAAAPAAKKKPATKKAAMKKAATKRSATKKAAKTKNATKRPAANKKSATKRPAAKPANKKSAANKPARKR